jgi:hypothetical protein
VCQGRGFPRNDSELRLSKELDHLGHTANQLKGCVLFGHRIFNPLFGTVSVEGISPGLPLEKAMDLPTSLKLGDHDPNVKRIFKVTDLVTNRNSKHLAYSFSISSAMPFPT